MIDLKDIGWDEHFAMQFADYEPDDFVPLRIIRDNRTNYSALGENGELICELSGKFRYRAGSKSEYPTVGDWVVASIRKGEDKATIHSLLSRKNTFSRKVPGEVTDEQVVAANIDTVFIVTGLDQNFNLRRIERYLSLAWETGSSPVILLNKSDLCDDCETRIAEVQSIAFGVDVIALSVKEDSGLEALDEYTKNGCTVAFFGSSGVGKSSIINRLLGNDYMKVNEVSKAGGKGKHTTTHRELLILPGGGMVIDTPGMRELQIWGDEDGFKQAFDDIEQLASMCQFRDCTHTNEPGCMIREALASDSLTSERFNSYLKLKKEYKYLASRQKMKANAIEKAKWKDIRKISRSMKNNPKNR